MTDKDRYDKAIESIQGYSLVMEWSPLGLVMNA